MLFLVTILFRLFCLDLKASSGLRFASGISSSEERRFWEADVVGSIPTSPTIALPCQIWSRAAVFRQRQRYSDVTASGVLRIGVIGSTCGFDLLGAGSYPASSSTRRHRNNAKMSGVVSLALRIKALRCTLNAEKEERYLQGQYCGCRIKVNTPGCDPDNAVSRSASHPIRSYQK